MHTYPFKDISPVIAKLLGTVKLETKLIKAVVIAVPAEGPSLGVAPSVKCIWIADFDNYNFYSSLRYLYALILAKFNDSYKTNLIFPDAIIYPFFSNSLSSKQLSTVKTCPIIPPTVRMLT